MSQQPPYGPPDPQQPHQQPQQPYQQPGYPPYGQNPYPNPYAQLPQQKSNTTRNVLLIVGAVVLLFCGGIVAFFAWAVNNVDDAFDPDYPGSEDQPLTVEEGEAFEIRGFEFEEGWTVTPAAGDLLVDGVRATNQRDDEDSASTYIVFKFYADNEQLATVNCSGGTSVSFERSVTLDCTSFATDVSGYDEIQVYDTSYSE